MKRLLIAVIVYLTLPLPVLASNIGLTLALEGKAAKAKVEINLNDNIKLYHSENYNREDYTRKGLTGIEFKINFDLTREKKDEDRGRNNI